MPLDTYKLIKPILFAMDAEKAHGLTFNSMRLLQNFPLFKKPSIPGLTQTCMGLTFANPLGLAAGLDKNAELIPIWEKMGFGFVEVGTVTPKPQIGNPKPRLFRLKKDRALINRMGFNNAGVDTVVNNIKKTKRNAVLGVNIGKNKDTPLEQADNDYLKCFHKVAAVADYITVNLSSPNTPGLRELQKQNYLNQLLDKLKDAQQKYQTKAKPLPICVKIAPDLTEAELTEIIQSLVNYKVEGLIATNTAVWRPESLLSAEKAEQGGLSGAPVFEKTNQILEKAKALSGDDLTLIGVGGIMNAGQAVQKRVLGADLVQIYSGLIYQGPKLVSDVLEAFVNEL